MIPDHINDDLFRRKKLSGKKGENIFAAGEVEYQVCFCKVFSYLRGCSAVVSKCLMLFSLDIEGKSVFYVTEQRKTDQKAIDKPILAAIKKNSEHKALFGYLGSRFMLETSRVVGTMSKGKESPKNAKDTNWPSKKRKGKVETKAREMETPPQ
ncbi:hypothetical protein COOONC_21566 [Cooperia oncophora]